MMVDLYDEIRRLEEHVTRIINRLPWTPTSVAYPPLNIFVFVRRPSYNGCDIITAQLKQDYLPGLPLPPFECNVWVDERRTLIEGVTHWMPLFDLDQHKIGATKDKLSSYRIPPDEEGRPI